MILFRDDDWISPRLMIFGGGVREWLLHLVSLRDIDGDDDGRIGVLRTSLRVFFQMDLS